MTDTNQQLQFQIQQELDDITLSVMAYRAEQIVSAISIANQKTNDTIQAKENYIREKFSDAIITMRDGRTFSPERTQELINRYTPLSALIKTAQVTSYFPINTTQTPSMSPCAVQKNF